MAAKPTLIAAGIAGALTLGTGGYFANEWRVCSGLEGDFLDRVQTIRNTAHLNALTATLGAPVDATLQRRAEDGNLKLMQMELQAVYERCGTDAGEAASLKGNNILFAI
jgi:hypothetical protein